MTRSRPVRTGRARRQGRWGIVTGSLAALAVLAFVPGVQPGASATNGPPACPTDAACAGSQGTDTSLPATWLMRQLRQLR